MIPKIIHQTWKNNEIPDNWKDAVNSCKKINNDFEYILWTHESMEEFVAQYYPEFLNTYTSYKHNIQRCDAFRYLVLYKYGGVYLDMDIICKKNLSDLLQYDIVLSRSANIDASFTNAFYMVIPNHPFIKFCIDNLPNYVNSWSFFGTHLHIMNSTGPMFLTNVINKYKLKNIKNMYILKNEEFAGDCNTCNENKCIGGIYFSHIVGRTWHEWDSTLYNFCFCNYKKIIIAIILVIVVCYFVFFRNIKKIITKLNKKII
jgi:mannosyltransferase OCH1-like enzyme